MDLVPQSDPGVLAGIRVVDMDLEHREGRLRRALRSEELVEKVDEVLTTEPVLDREK